jgi:hypothetical protein
MQRALARWREDAVVKMLNEAYQRGANAVVGMRFDHRELTNSWTEICAYGTAGLTVLGCGGSAGVVLHHKLLVAHHRHLPAHQVA